MKNITALTAILLFAVSVATAQSGSAFFHKWKDINDTLGVNTTKTYNFNALTDAFGNGTATGQNISDTWSYSITIEADSLSGAASDSSTIFLQVCNCGVDESNPLWVTIEDDEINGTATQVFHYTGDILEPRMQLIIRSKSGTKAIALRSFATFKRKYKTR